MLDFIRRIFPRWLPGIALSLWACAVPAAEPARASALAPATDASALENAFSVRAGEPLR